MIPSRVQHPCIMPVQAVFADAIYACVDVVTVGSRDVALTSERTNTTSRAPPGDGQVHPDALVQRWRHEGVARMPRTPAKCDGSVPGAAWHIAGTASGRVRCSGCGKDGGVTVCACGAWPGACALAWSWHHSRRPEAWQRAPRRPRQASHCGLGLQPCVAWLHSHPRGRHVHRVHGRLCST